MKSIADVMTHNLYVAAPHDSVFECAKKMAEKKVSSLLIMEEHNVVGIVTSRDILEKILVLRKSPDEHIVADIMSTPVISFPLTGSILELFIVMEQHHVKQIPIVDQNGSLAGVVTQTDLVRAISHMLELTE